MLKSKAVVDIELFNGQGHMLWPANQLIALYVYYIAKKKRKKINAFLYLGYLKSVMNELIILMAEKTRNHYQK